MRPLSTQECQSIVGAACIPYISAPIEVSSSEMVSLSMEDVTGIYEVTLYHDCAIYGNGTVAVSGPGVFSLGDTVFTATATDAGMAYVQTSQFCI